MSTEQITETDPRAAAARLLLSERLSFLRLELTLLDGKMKQIVDRLWQIRALCVTLWSGALAIGLGVGTADKEPIPPVLLLTPLFPIWFAWIDSSYQRWYRRFRAREEAISRFVYDENYVLPSTGAPMSLVDNLTHGVIRFPVLDLYAEATYGRDHPKIRWFTSRFSNLADSTPVIVYGVQLAASTVVISVTKVFDPWWIFAASVAVAVLLMSGVGLSVRRRALGSQRRDRDAPPSETL